MGADPVSSRMVSMPYAHRPMHDADSHVMETPRLARAPRRSRACARSCRARTSPRSSRARTRADRRTSARSTPIRPTAPTTPTQILLRKNWAATGSFLKEDRPRALDLLGFESQLVFNTFLNGNAARGRARRRPRLRLRLRARPQPRDARLLLGRPPPARRPCYVPLRDFERAARWPREAIAAGAKALLVPSGCPRGHSPSHVGLDPGLGAGRRRPACRSCSTSAAAPRRRRSAARPRLLRERRPAGARLPRRRRELPLGRLHGDPDRADADARDADLRRRARPLPAACSSA